MIVRLLDVKLGRDSARSYGHGIDSLKCSCSLDAPRQHDSVPSERQRSFDGYL